MGNKAGRLCLLHQVTDLEEQHLKYRCQTSLGKIEGLVKSEDELYHAISVILDFYKTDQIEVSIKILEYDKIKGLCIRSFPQTYLTQNILSLINLCVGGQSGTDLIHLPYQGTILDQPNLFIQAYYIYVGEVSRFYRTKKEKENTQEFKGKPTIGK